MTAVAVAGAAAEWPGDLLGGYDGFVDALDVNPSQRWQRRRAARLFLARHPDLEDWMSRPTPARLADLHRLKAWPLLTWLVVDGRVRLDLELLLAKPGGVDLGVWWSIAHAGDVERATTTGSVPATRSPEPAPTPTSANSATTSSPTPTEPTFSHPNATTPQITSVTTLEGPAFSGQRLCGFLCCPVVSLISVVCFERGPVSDP